MWRLDRDDPMLEAFAVDRGRKGQQPVLVATKTEIVDDREDSHPGAHRGLSAQASDRTSGALKGPNRSRHCRPTHSAGPSKDGGDGSSAA